MPTPIPPSLEYPPNAYCTDSYNRRLEFCFPSIRNPDVQSTELSIIERLPNDLIEVIILDLHPVDRICLSLASKTLLQDVFSQSIKGKGRAVWSQSLSPKLRTGPIRDIHCFIFRFNCTHDRFATGVINPCLTCAQEQGPQRSIASQLTKGWDGLLKDEWAYCDSCRHTKWTDLKYWLRINKNGETMIETEAKVLKHGWSATDMKYDSVIMPDLPEESWTQMNHRARLAWIARQWRCRPHLPRHW